MCPAGRAAPSVRASPGRLAFATGRGGDVSGCGRSEGLAVAAACRTMWCGRCGHRARAALAGSFLVGNIFEV
jgi:hypothetical protein